ncbi:MAG: TVP38/TMEM64 family protein [Rectinemataceae bacterium]
MPPRQRKLLAIIAFPLFILAIVALFWVFRTQILGVLASRDSLRAWLQSFGTWGYLVFILVQAFQVVVFMVPGEVVQVAGGWIYGFWAGTLLSVIGICLGSLVNFSAGRLLGKPFVVSLFGEAQVAKMEGIASTGKAAAGFFLLFVIPGIPKDVLCYVAGITPMRFWVFLVISLVGRLPGILGSSLMGAAAGAGDYKVAVIVLAFASLLFIVGVLKRDKIVAGLEGLLSSGKGGGKDGSA